MKKLVVIMLIIIFCLPGLFTQMNPARTSDMPEIGFKIINDSHVSVFLKKTNSGYIMFDSGVNLENIKENFREQEISLNEVHTIFLSHSDRDHVASLDLFSNAKIYIGEEEILLLEGKIIRRDDRYNSLPDGVGIERIAVVNDGQEFDFDGVKIKCISAPGHTPGSMLYLIDNNFLITGDAFSFVNGEADIHPFTMDEKQSRETIERHRSILQTTKYIMSSHYGIITK